MSAGAESAPAAVIRLEGVHKVYANGKLEVHALRGVDLVVRRGEFLAIMGPSGSGKTTLLEILGCLSRPSSGHYWLAGSAADAIDADALARLRGEEIGFVFQSFNLLPQLTALENVEMPLLFGGVGGRERRRRATELLERLGLGDRGEHKPTELSGGQMQRVAIARALAMDPDVVLADEPTGNLDTGSGADVMTLLNDLWQHGSTVVVVTHDKQLAAKASRTIELRDGEVIRDERNGGTEA
jgi:putative ABC transport system ATP-binding protein